MPDLRPSLPLLCLAALSLLVGAGCAKAPAAAGAPGALVPISLQSDWYAEAEQGGFYQALANGYYREAGIDLNLMNGGPGSYALQKVAAGNADMALGRSDDVILAVSGAHLPLVIVCAYMEKDPMAVLVHADSPVRDFPDLAGRVVMVDPTSAWPAYLKARYHMDFGIIPLNYGLGQFLADKNFIVQGFATNEPYYIQKKGVAARTLLIANSGYNPYRVVYANKGFVRAHPAAVQAFVAATIQGWRDFLAGDPAPAKRIIFQRNETMTEEFMAFSTAAMQDNHFVSGDAAKGEELGLMTPRRMQQMVDTYVQLKVLPAPLPLDQFVSFDFLPPDLAAKAR